MKPGEKRVRIRHVGLWFFCLAVLVFLILPTIIVIPMSFTTTKWLVFPPQGFTWDWYYKFFNDETWINSTLFSLELAALATLVSLVIGTMAALAMTRGSLPFKNLLRLFFLSPLMTPIIAIAYAAYGVFVSLKLIGTTTGMVLAHSIICVPYVVLVISANLFRMDANLELAARNLGATTVGAFRYVTLPLIKPGILSAGIFCFIESLDEMVLALFLVGHTKMTLPLRIFSDIQFRISPVVASASTIFIAAAVATLVFETLSKKQEQKGGQGL